MQLQPGTTLGPYSVSAKIGEDGMGEVWQARDTKLDRDVALKVLPEAFTSDPDRQTRAVDDEMDGLVGRTQVELDIEVLTTPRERGVVGRFEVDVHQGQDRP